MPDEARSEDAPERTSREDDELRRLIEQVEAVVQEVREVDREYEVQVAGQSADCQTTEQQQLTLSNNMTIRLNYRDTKIA